MDQPRRREAQGRSNIHELDDIQAPFADLVAGYYPLRHVDLLREGLLAQPEALPLGKQNSDERPVPLIVEALRHAHPLKNEVVAAVAVFSTKTSKATLVRMLQGNLMATNMGDDSTAETFADELIAHSRFRWGFRLVVNAVAIGILFSHGHKLLAGLPMAALWWGWDIHRLHVRVLRGREEELGSRSRWLPFQMAYAKTGPIWLGVALALWFSRW